MRMPDSVVTLDDTRSQRGGIGTPEKCFYCEGKLGEEHDFECVVRERPVKVRVTFDTIVAVAESFNYAEVEAWFTKEHLNSNFQISLSEYNNDHDFRLVPGSFDATYLRDVSVREAVEAGLKIEFE